jgi:hypothetical protein
VPVLPREVEGKQPGQPRQKLGDGACVAATLREIGRRHRQAVHERKGRLMLAA